MQTKIIERYFFFIFLFATFIFSFFIFRPFWIVLVLGISFSIVLYPIHERLNKKLPNWLSALLTVLFFVAIIGAPLFGIGIMVFNQSQNAYQTIITNVHSLSFIDSINNSINGILPEGISFNLYEKISSFISFISDNMASIFTSTLSTVFSSVLVLLSIFYFLKDGRRWRKALVILSPLSDADDQKIINKLSRAVKRVHVEKLYSMAFSAQLCRNLIDADRRIPIHHCYGSIFVWDNTQALHNLVLRL